MINQIFFYKKETQIFDHVINQRSGNFKSDLNTNKING